MSRRKRVDKIRENALNKFVSLYFDEKYPNTTYTIKIRSQFPLLIQVNNKNDEYQWMLYTCTSTNKLLSDIQVVEYRKHLSALKIQMWWKKIFYDPRMPFIEPFMEKKYDEYFN